MHSVKISEEYMALKSKPRKIAIFFARYLLLVSSLAYSSTLKMEFSEASDFFRTTLNYKPRDDTLHHRCENLKPSIWIQSETFHPFTLKATLISFSHPRLCLQINLFALGLLTKILTNFSSLTRSASYGPFNFIFLVIPGRQHKSWSSPYWNFLSLLSRDSP
jgi:hypothetical protein